MQTGCDANVHLVCASCNHSGSTNDIIACQDCNLYQMLEVEKLLPLVRLLSMGIFWRAYIFSFDHWPLVVLVTMRLQNLCMDRQYDIPPHCFAADVQPSEAWAVNDNLLYDDWVHRE